MSDSTEEKAIPRKPADEKAGSGGSAKKKAAAKKASASSKTEKSSTKKAAPAKKKRRTPAVDGVQGARMRRLIRQGFSGADRCALLGIELDIGLRASPWCRPVRVRDQVLSELGSVIVASGVSADALELAASRMREED